jgi:hypothetical protein
MTFKSCDFLQLHPIAFFALRQLAETSRHTGSFARQIGGARECWT